MTTSTYYLLLACTPIATDKGSLKLRTEMSMTSNRQSKCKLASINSFCILCDNDALIVSCFAKLRMKFYTGLQNIVGVYTCWKLLDNLMYKGPTS